MTNIQIYTKIVSMQYCNTTIYRYTAHPLYWRIPFLISSTGLTAFKSHQATTCIWLAGNPWSADDVKPLSLEGDLCKGQWSTMKDLARLLPARHVDVSAVNTTVVAWESYVVPWRVQQRQRAVRSHKGHNWGKVNLIFSGGYDTHSRK